MAASIGIGRCAFGGLYVTQFAPALARRFSAMIFRDDHLGVADTKRIRAPRLVAAVLTAVYGLPNFPALLRMFAHAARVPGRTCRTRHFSCAASSVLADWCAIYFEPMASRREAQDQRPDLDEGLRPVSHSFRIGGRS
jgi:hypothetical protein